MKANTISSVRKLGKLVTLLVPEASADEVTALLATKVTASFSQSPSNYSLGSQNSTLYCLSVHIVLHDYFMRRSYLSIIF